MRIASDTGGTFTDLVDASGRVVKIPSTPHDPAQAVRDGIEHLVSSGADGPVVPVGSVATGRVDVLAHGTTVATNTLLERTGSRVALVTTSGFADVIEIARQDRPSLYDNHVDRPEPLVPRHRRYEVVERLDASGHELIPVDPTSLGAIDDAVDVVAVCLLHSDLDPGHEHAVAALLTDRGLDVTTSSEISPEFREYERTSTTVVNAYLRGACRSYLRELDSIAHEVLVMTSAGGLTPVEEAIDRPAALLLSGPAGGVAAGAAAAVANGYPDAITFDMGGTSTDVCLVLGGRPEPASEREVAGLPVRLPCLDVHTIGAGGGSIAALDAGGALTVGPRSAGAVPGPACYGRAGTEPTVTDANLVVGHLDAEVELPGIGRLDLEAARAAFEWAGVSAEGVLAVVNAHMEQALRRVSVERGVDPRGLALVAFGGAGPLHACSLADALGIPAVIIPARAGVLSAVGILGASRRVDLVRSWKDPGDHAAAEDAARLLATEAAHRLAGDNRIDSATGGPSRDPSRNPSRGPTRGPIDDPVDEPAVGVSWELDCRYEGQSHELRVGRVSDFHAEHRRRNGYERPDHRIEVVAVRASATVASPVNIGDLPAVERRSALGPAVISEPDCTIWIPDGWRAEPGAAGALVLTRVGR